MKNFRNFSGKNDLNSAKFKDKIKMKLNETYFEVQAVEIVEKK